MFDPEFLKNSDEIFILYDFDRKSFIFKIFKSSKSGSKIICNPLLWYSSISFKLFVFRKTFSLSKSNSNKSILLKFFKITLVISLLNRFFSSFSKSLVSIQSISETIFHSSGNNKFSELISEFFVFT